MSINPMAEPDQLQIPSEVAEIPQEQEAPEAEPLYISFARYNSKECQINGMDGKIAKKALKTIRDIGVNICGQSDFGSLLPKLEVKTISPFGEYKALYAHLADIADLEISEAKIDKDDSRMFFFIIDRVFYVVAVRQTHYTTGKHSR